MYIHVVGDVYSVCLLDCVGGDGGSDEGATADRPTGGSDEEEEEDEERMFIAFSCAQPHVFLPNQDFVECAFWLVAPLLMCDHLLMYMCCAIVDDR